MAQIVVGFNVPYRSLPLLDLMANREGVWGWEPEEGRSHNHEGVQGVATVSWIARGF